MITFHRMADGRVLTIPRSNGVAEATRVNHGRVVVNHRTEINDNSFIQWSDGIKVVIHEYVHVTQHDENISEEVIKQEELEFRIIDFTESNDWRVESVRVMNDAGLVEECAIYKVKPFSQWLIPEIEERIKSLGFGEATGYYVEDNEFKVGGTLAEIRIGRQNLFRDTQIQELQEGYFGTEEECIKRIDTILDIFEDDLAFVLQKRRQVPVSTGKAWLEHLKYIQNKVTCLSVYKREQSDQRMLLNEIQRFILMMENDISFMSNQKNAEKDP